MRRSLSAVLLLGTCSFLASCGSKEEGVLRISAASSLTGVFEAIEQSFEDRNPDVDLEFNFASSSDLATQIIDGSPVDVFASADTKNMVKISGADLIEGEAEIFATNTLEIIVAPGNPLGIAGLDDLADESLVFVTCDPSVPIGKYTQELFTNTGVTVQADSLEENVKAIVTKVASGEADAGIVYVTDVIAAGEDASGVTIPADINVVANYPIAVLKDSKNPGLARRFLDFLVSDEGQRILQRFGFGPVHA